MGCILSSSRSAQTPAPPTPSVLLSSPRGTYHVRRPKDRKRDTPLSTVYRIYWAIVMDDTISMRNEIEYFWNRKEESWKVHNIPRPRDEDPQRFAVVSAIPFVLATAFNRLINLGLPRYAGGGILTSEELDKLMQEPKLLENIPQWALDAPPLRTPLRLPTGQIGSPETADDEDADPFMARKNVLVWKLHILFT